MYNIMVVDDAIFMRNIIKKILTSHRYTIVAEASTGREAVLQYKAMKPNLTLMDITMPDLTGTEAVKEIIAFDPQAKIVMCSAMGQKVMVVEAITNGAKGFIVKPFDAKMVIETVSSLIGVPPDPSDIVEIEEKEAPAETTTATTATPVQEEEDEVKRDMSSLERRLRRELKVK